MTQDASRFVGSIPDNYDRYLVPRIFDGYAADMARRIAGLSPARLLELAAGTGIVTRKLRDLLPRECEILATDLNEPMLEVARSRFSSQESVDFDQADATNLAFSDESFDAVACQFGVMFFPDKNRSYEEVYRILKPGGNYVFNVWDSLSENPFAKNTSDVLAKLFPEDPPGFYNVPFHYHDAGDIRRAVLEAGFDRVSIDLVRSESEIPSPRDFARGLVFGNPIVEEIVDRGGDPEIVCEAITEAIENQLGASMPLSALVIEARKA